MVGQFSPGLKLVNLPNPFLTDNVFTVDTLHHAVTLTFDLLTLNVCGVSAVT